MKSIRHSLLLTSMAVLGLLAAPIPTWADCIVHFVDYNKNRYVFGNVHTECEWPRAPFGNWGVDSLHDGRSDTNQFMGWADTEGHLEWNSCTDGYPYSQYFNHDNNTTQWSGDTVAFANYYSESLPWECPEDEIISISNFFMDLWELDDGFCCGNDDDHVSTIYYPSFDIDLSCSDGYCTGSSDWIEPSGSPYPATAPVQMFIELIPA